MAGQMTLFYIMSCHNEEQAQCYQINVNLFHCALTERKPEGVGGPSTLLVSRWERWDTSYSYNLYNYATLNG